MTPVRSLLVTNDFPPKVGGIQSYLGELWRRLPAEETVVFAPDFPGDSDYDAEQSWPVVRNGHKLMIGRRRLAARVRSLVEEHDIDVVLADPLAMVGPAMVSRSQPMTTPWAPIIHGAEVTIPGRVPVLRSVMRSVLNRADFVVAAGGYPLAEAEKIAGRSLDAVLIPPGVDTSRFVPLDEPERAETRRRFGLVEDDVFVLSLSRLVPRKGFDVLIKAAHRLAGSHPRLVVGIAGGGRDDERLRRLAASGPGRIRFFGRVPDADMPGLYGASDVFCMLCRNRWMGWEQEGFGIVFLEAAAAGVPTIVGRSGGSHEAVADGQSGLVVDDPTSVAEAAAALETLVDDDNLRRSFGEFGRNRAVDSFDYDVLTAQLRKGIAERLPGGPS